MRSLLLPVIRYLFPHWVKNALQLSLQDIERYQPLEVRDLPPGERILVLAPHPDDECIGCGGTLRKSVRAGRDVRVLVLTDGRLGSSHIRDLPDNDPQKQLLQEELVTTREAETRAAMALLGISEIEFFRAADGGLTEAVVEVGTRLAEYLDRWRPDTVLLPFVTDRHADHFATSRCLVEACSRLDDAYTRKLLCLGFEDWSPIFANLLIDVSDDMQTKLDAIGCYASQLTSTDYAAGVEGLNRYRAVSGMTGGRYAEAYFQCSLPHYERLYRQLLL